MLRYPTPAKAAQAICPSPQAVLQIVSSQPADPRANSDRLRLPCESFASLQAAYSTQILLPTNRRAHGKASCDLAASLLPQFPRLPVATDILCVRSDP